jgi:hypothetical protein
MSLAPRGCRYPREYKRAHEIVPFEESAALELWVDGVSASDIRCARGGNSV